MRFTVVSEDGYAWIKDNQAKKWSMPEKTVSINFANVLKASTVSDLLNKEWGNFLANPS